MANCDSLKRSLASEMPLASPAFLAAAMASSAARCSEAIDNRSRLSCTRLFSASLRPALASSDVRCLASSAAFFAAVAASLAASAAAFCASASVRASCVRLFACWAAKPIAAPWFCTSLVMPSA